MGKKLTKKELKSALKSSVLNPLWTDRFTSGDRFDNYTVYNHSNREFILIEPSAGNGFWYDEEALNALYKQKQGILRNLERGIQSSLDHWRFYTKVNDNIPLLLEDLIIKVQSITGLPPKDLDLTLSSIKKIDATISNSSYEEDSFLEKMYDPLVGYIGEYMRIKSSGHWVVEDGLPCIATPRGQVLMPINVVSGAAMSLGTVSLYKEAKRETYNLRYEM